MDQIGKTQVVRIIDVVVIGPGLIYLGTRKQKYKAANLFLLVVGITTIFYNGYNYLKQKKITDDTN